MTAITSVQDAAFSALLAGTASGKQIQEQLRQRADSERETERHTLAEEIADLQQQQVRLEEQAKALKGEDNWEERRDLRLKVPDLDRQIAKLERRLRQLADPRIAEFIGEMLRQYEVERRSQINCETDMERGPHGNLRPVTVASTYESLSERLQAIRAARETAEALKLRVGIDVAKELQALRDGLPPIEMRRLR